MVLRVHLAIHLRLLEEEPNVKMKNENIFKNSTPSEAREGATSRVTGMAWFGESCPCIIDFIIFRRCGESWPAEAWLKHKDSE